MILCTLSLIFSILTKAKGAVQDDKPGRLDRIEELAIYLWENYIEYEFFYVGKIPPF